MSALNLLDARFDQDSCGVGFVASVDAVPSHSILTQALTALARLAHRGAIASDGKSSDGVGIMTSVPRDLLLRSRVRAWQLNTGIEMTLGLGQGARQSFALGGMIGGRTRN